MQRDVDVRFEPPKGLPHPVPRDTPAEGVELRHQVVCLPPDPIGVEPLPERRDLHHGTGLITP
jgi:hypothetical protein